MKKNSYDMDATLQRHFGQSYMLRKIKNIDRDDEGNIIAIGHFGVILTQLQRAAKIEARSAISFQIDNLSITHIEHLGETNWRILGVNNKV